MIFVLRTGIPWRDLPTKFGKWTKVYAQFRRWSLKGIWNEALKQLYQEFSDCEYVMIDSSIMRVHQDGSNPRGGQYRQAMGKSKGGLSSKIHIACDALGYPLSCIITGGERHDSTQATALLKRHLTSNSFALLDAGYDSDDIRKFVNNKNSTSVIAYRKNRLKIPEFDKHIYKERHKVENLFQKLKRFRRIGTRYEKNHNLFKAMVSLASILLYIKC